MTAKTLTATALSLLDMRILKEVLLVSGGQYPVSYTHLRAHET